MREGGDRWAMVLAGGSGSRLQTLTGDGAGRAVPKQYCSLSGGPSLLEEALARARRVVPRNRVVVVVAEEHEAWWRPALSDLPEKNVVVQPLNRGTGAGVLLPLLTVLERDPEATVAVLPSDHFVADEEILTRSLHAALEAAEHDRDRIFLLGIQPDAADAEYGWIVPAGALGNGVVGVSAFVEKPRPEMARELRRRGAVWNSFLFAATGPALRALFLRRRPSLIGALSPLPRQHLGPIYSALPISDFSRDLLQGSEDRLALLPVPACGWNDLGTPARVTACIARWRTTASSPSTPIQRAPVNLAAALALG